MKVLLINGSPNKTGCTYTALQEVENKLNENGVETEIYQIGTKPVSGCIDCSSCRKTGKCIYDDVNAINARADEFDALIVGSPVYYAGPSGEICSLLDRLFRTSGGRWSGKPGAAVVSCRRGGATAAFDRLNKYFSISNMPIVSSNYWNQVHGNTPEEVKEDREGLQTMRVLAENLTYLLRCIDAGKKAGVPKPAYEPRIYTNFIR